MDLRNLNTFLHVAELGSFSAAGQRLGYSQPTVSVQVKLLEEELGVRLFDRMGHAVRLTEPGREVLAYAQQICTLCDRLSRHGGEQTDVLVRIATADSLCAPLMRREFPQLRRLLPGLRVRLMAAGTDELVRMLDRGEADLVCTLDNRIVNAAYCIAGEERIGLHFVAAPGHPLAKSGPVTPQSLLGHDLLLTEEGMSYRRLLDQWLAEAGLQSQPTLECGSADLLAELAAEGGFVAFLPDYVTERRVQAGSLVRLEAAGFQPALWKQVLYHCNKWLSPALKRVIDHLATALLAPFPEN